jgi:hypothetical protein
MPKSGVELKRLWRALGTLSTRLRNGTLRRVSEVASRIETFNEL